MEDEFYIEDGHIFIGTRKPNEKLIKLNILLVIYYYEKRYDAAMDEVTALTYDPEMAEHKAYLTLLQGQISELQGNFDTTLRYYCHAFIIGQWSPYLRYYFWNHIGICWLLKKKFMISEWCCRKAIKLNSKRGDAWMHLGISLEFQGKITEAVQCYAKAILLNINFKSILHLHQLIWKAQGIQYPKFLMFL